MAEKKRVEIDGYEVPGLVSCDEIKLERNMIEVPSFSRIRQLPSGITKIPVVTLKYKLERSTETLEFFQNWYTNMETHDVVIIRTDAVGVEFARRLLPDCECNTFTDPGYDAANPEYASLTVVLTPWDIKFLSAEQ